MSKSHVAGWASDSPTPAQLKEFFAQIENGRITKYELQKLLRGDSHGIRVSHGRAREIMGANMFGIEEAIKHFGVNPSRQQTAALADVPFTEATLEACKETHVLVAVFPLSIIEIRSKAKLFYDQSWYNKESFAKDRGDVSWQLVRKTPVSNSTSKTWQEQQALLGANEETPSARVMVYTIIGHYLATGERLFEGIYVRCSDVDSHGSRVDVGDFGSLGLYVSNRWGDRRGSNIGVSAARKFDAF